MTVIISFFNINVVSSIEFSSTQTTVWIFV